MNYGKPKVNKINTNIIIKIILLMILFSVCGCGSGDSGCSECGICKTCSGENIASEEEIEQMGVGLDLLEEMLTDDKERGFLFPLEMIKAQSKLYVLNLIPDFKYFCPRYAKIIKLYVIIL